MCGRYRAKGQLIDQLPEDYFRENLLLAKFEDRYNIGPGQKAPIVRKRKKERPQVESIAWKQPPYYLARSDSLLTKPSYRQALLERRCLIPMHGFYEWDEKTTPRQPWHFQMKDESLMMVAGLWSIQNGEACFTLVTTEPNDVVTPVHHRMPAIIAPENWNDWLSEDTQVDMLSTLLGPYTTEPMAGWPISLKVNKIQNDDPSLIERHTSTAMVQGELF